MTDASLSAKPSFLPSLLKRIWRKRVPNMQALLQHAEKRQQQQGSRAFGRRAVPETLQTCPLDLSIAAGWILEKSSEATAAAS